MTRKRDGGAFIHQVSKSLVVKFDRLVYWGRDGTRRDAASTRPLTHTLGFDLLSATAAPAITHAISCSASSAIQPVNHRQTRAHAPL